MGDASKQRFVTYRHSSSVQRSVSIVTPNFYIKLKTDQRKCQIQIHVSNLARSRDSDWLWSLSKGVVAGVSHEGVDFASNSAGVKYNEVICCSQKVIH